MNTLLKPAAFVLLACLQLAVPASRIVMKELVLRQGTVHRFLAAPVDPADPFRGRYVALRLAENEAPWSGSEDLSSGQTVYAAIGISTNGFSCFTAASLTPPATGDYIKAHVRYAYSDKISLTLPFDRYYMRETLAPEAEKAYRSSLRDRARPTYITVRVKSGTAVLEALYIDGKPVHEYLKQH